MPRLLDGRTRVYSTGKYIDVDIVENGEWVGYSAVQLMERAETIRHQVKQATVISEAVLGAGNARVDVEPDLERFLSQQPERG